MLLNRVLVACCITTTHKLKYLYERFEVYNAVSTDGCIGRNMKDMNLCYLLIYCDASRPESQSVPG
jgi:hypothetical protein